MTCDQCQNLVGAALKAEKMIKKYKTMAEVAESIAAIGCFMLGPLEFGCEILIAEEGTVGWVVVSFISDELLVDGFCKLKGYCN